MALRFTLRQLEYFVAVGEAGSIAVAAEKVNVSSPSISAAISQLEKEFGLQLFVRRHAHGLSLTQAGRQFMEQAKVVLFQADSLNRLAGDISGTVRGPLAVGCLLTFAQVVLPTLRRSFSDLHPEVRLRQDEQDQSELFERLRRAELDVALTYGMSIPADLKFEPLAELPPYAMMAPDHPMADRKTVTVEDLRDYSMVLIDLPISASYFMSFFNASGIKPQITERSRDMAVVRSLVANGFGYSIVNTRPTTDIAPDGRPLRYVPLETEVPPMALGLATVEGADHALTVRAFLDHCRTEITNHNVPGLVMNIPAKG